jgi:hypothetical protein
MPVAKKTITPKTAKPKVAKTKVKSVDLALMQQYSNDILRYLGASWATEGDVGLDENDSIYQQICDFTVEAYSKVEEALGLNGIGLKKIEIVAFEKQQNLWHIGALDFDNARQLNTFNRCQALVLSEIRNIYLEYEDDLLTENMKAMKYCLSPEQLELIDYYSGLQLRLPNKKYYTKKNIKILVSRLRKLIPELNTVLVGANKPVQNIDREQEFELSPGYTDLLTRMDNLLVNYPNATKVQGYSRTLDFAGEGFLKEASPTDYKLYSELTKQLKAEALRSLYTNLAYNEGEPMRVLSLRSTMKSDGVYIPPNIMPSENFTGYAIEVNNNGKFDVAYLSPFKEPLDKIPRGNVVMNPAYQAGSNVYVCTYSDPVSRMQSKQHVATKGADKDKRINRYEKILDLIDNVDDYRSKWLRDIKTFATMVKQYNTANGGSLAALQTRVKRSETPPTPLPIKDIRIGVFSLLCELGYQVAPRTGEKGNATEVNGIKVPTYALSTLKLDHLESSPTDFNPAYAARLNDQTGVKTLIKPSQVQKLVFTYAGKDAQRQQHLISKQTLGGDADAKATWDALTGYMLLLSDQLYTQQVQKLDHPLSKLLQQQIFKVPNANATSNPLWVDVDNKMLLNYLKTRIGFGGQTFKAFRKLKATKVFKDFMDNAKDSLTTDNIDKVVMLGAKQAGMALGHAAAKGTTSGDVALKYYIVPQMVSYYYELIGATPNGKIQSVIKSVSKDT